MFARGKLTLKLMQELNWHGFTYKEVDPVLTSQTCPVCNNVDKNNRDGKRFVCTCCGHSDDADHVGALNILSRATDAEIQSISDKYHYSLRKREDGIRSVLCKRHKDWLKANKNQKEPKMLLDKLSVLP